MHINVILVKSKQQIVYLVTIVIELHGLNRIINVCIINYINYLKFSCLPGYFNDSQ